MAALFAFLKNDRTRSLLNADSSPLASRSRSSPGQFDWCKPQFHLLEHFDAVEVASLSFRNSPKALLVSIG